LLGDQTGCEANFTWSTTNADAHIRFVCSNAVANLLDLTLTIDMPKID